MARQTKRVLSLATILCLALSTQFDTVMANDTQSADDEHPEKIGDVKCLPFPNVLQEYDNSTWEIFDHYTPPEIPGKWTPPDKVDKDIKQMMSKMTIEEKVGQMMQIEIGKFIGCDGNLNKTAVIDWLDQWKIGSILETPANHGGRFAWYTPHTFADIIDEIQDLASKHGSKIPILYGIDNVHGADYIKGTTIFPQSIGMAATFNPKLVEDGHRINAKDTRSAGIPWVFTPILDLGVSKIWPRIYEGYGEDPLLISRMGAASTTGLQGNLKMDRSRVAASVKHFIAYGVPISGLDIGSRMVPDHTLFEYYLPPFQAVVDAGAATFMHSYSVLNQESVVTSQFYLKELLREKIHFKGMMVTDWGEINKAVNEHFTAGDIKQATHQALEYTSTDLNMIPDDADFGRVLLELLKEGKVKESRIDESVGRLLQLKKDLGLFENAKTDRSLIKTVGSKQDREAAFESARQSLTLLKNTNSVLPIKPEEKVLVVGPTASSIRFLSGGWTVHWQGPNEAEGDSVFDGQGITILEGIEQVTGNKPHFINVTDIDGNHSQQDFDEVVKAAQSVDKVIVCLGEKTYTEIGGNIDHLDLPQGQLDLVRVITENSKAKVAVVLVEGRPRSLQDIPDRVDGILQAYLPGPWGGLPIAQALFGKFSPTGRLPYTYPRFDRQSPLTYWMPVQDIYDPQWAFGTGMGYSDIKYSDLKLSKSHATVGDKIEIEVTVTNNGPYDQLEPILVYTSQKFRPLYSPERWRLRDFTKIHLKVGEKRIVKFTLDTEHLGFYSNGHHGVDYVHTSGPFDVVINANSLVQNSLSAPFNLTAPNSPFI